MTLISVSGKPQRVAHFLFFYLFLKLITYNAYNTLLKQKGNDKSIHVEIYLHNEQLFYDSLFFFFIIYTNIKKYELSSGLDVIRAVSLPTFIALPPSAG